MNKIDIICVGKIKEKFFSDAINEYLKRLSAFCKVNIIETYEQPFSQSPNAKEIAKGLEEEAGHILKKLDKDSFSIALCIEGDKLSSEDFAQLMKNEAVKGKSKATFIIGGSFGIDEQVKKLCNFRLSFSKMTFPHQLMRVVLLEQVYRTYKINANQPYHK